MVRAICFLLESHEISASTLERSSRGPLFGSVGAIDKIPAMSSTTVGQSMATSSRDEEAGTDAGFARNQYSAFPCPMLMISESIIFVTINDQSDKLHNAGIRFLECKNLHQHSQTIQERKLVL